MLRISPGRGTPGSLAPDFDRRKAALKYLDRAERRSDFHLERRHHRAAGCGALGRGQVMARSPLGPWRVRGGALAAPAHDPGESDRGKFNDGLRSPQREIAETCLSALERLPPPQSVDELLPLVRALRSLSDSKADAELRDRLTALLRSVAHRKMGSDRQAWIEWFAETYPEQAAQLGRTDGVDRAAWNKRLAGLEWGTGDAIRGRRSSTRRVVPRAIPERRRSGPTCTESRTAFRGMICSPPSSSRAKTSLRNIAPCNLS